MKFKMKKRFLSIAILAYVLLIYYLFAFNSYKLDDIRVIYVNICLFALIVVLIVFSFVKVDVENGSISRPYIIGKEMVEYDSIFEIKISRSSISGYSAMTVSYLDKFKSNRYFIVGSWFSGYDKLFSHIIDNSKNAKLIYNK